MQALNFYSGHGCNVRLPDLQTAEHSYRRAQGLFILATPLNEESKFQLRFEGEGGPINLLVVAFGLFDYIFLATHQENCFYDMGTDTREGCHRSRWSLLVT